jgi:hypothetical protein
MCSDYCRISKFKPSPISIETNPTLLHNLVMCRMLCDQRNITECRWVTLASRDRVIETDDPRTGLSYCVRRVVAR